MITVEINNRQSFVGIDEVRMRRAIEGVLTEEGIAAATVSVAIVDDLAIHDLNRRFLNHDEPTDVLSFLLDDSAGIEGDVVVSAETAARNASKYAWSPGDELLLYVVHGTLHLVGYDDIDPASRAEMRGREKHFLAAMGLQPRYENPEAEAAETIHS